MEQQQTRVSFPIGTKLLVSVLALLLGTVLFLTVSAALVVERDKKAYVFQTQATAVELVGREFVQTSRRGLETLRLLLASLRPGQRPADAPGRPLQEAVNNQSTLEAVSLGNLDTGSGELRSVVRFQRSSPLQHAQSAQAFELSAGVLKPRLKELLDRSFVFLNVSRPGLKPLLAVVMADVAQRSRAEGMPVAFGFFPVDGLGQGLQDFRLTVIAGDGRILFDTDATAQVSAASLGSEPLFTFSGSNALNLGTHEYPFQGEKWLGTYFKPGLELVILARTSLKAAMRSATELVERFVLLGLAAVGAALLFTVLFARSLSAPIRRLEEATRQVSQGRFQLELPAASRDEIGSLSRSFVTMSRRIGELMVERERKLQLENELSIASAVQKNLIPSDRLDLGPLKIRSLYQAATACGGDWWGVFPAGDHRQVVLIGDATGHGLSSALITAAAQSAASLMERLVEENPGLAESPAKLLEYANRSIFGASRGNLMMTFLVALVDPARGRIRYSNAGHPPPWIFKPGVDRPEHHSLVGAGSRLGEALENEPFEEHEVAIAPGDLLLLYTDGLIDGKNAYGEVFGKKRALKVALESAEHGAESLLDGLVSEYLVHSERKALDDDLTLVVLEIS